MDRELPEPPENSGPVRRYRRWYTQVRPRHRRSVRHCTVPHRCFQCLHCAEYYKKRTRYTPTPDFQCFLSNSTSLSLLSRMYILVVWVEASTSTREGTGNSRTEPLYVAIREYQVYLSRSHLSNRIRERNPTQFALCRRYWKSGVRALLK